MSHRNHCCVFVVALLWSALATGAGPLPRQGFLGIEFRSIPAAERDQAKDGAYVARVLDGSAAAAAGFQAGDIFVALDGRPLSGPHADRQAADIIHALRAGDTIEVTYLRAGKTAQQPATLNPIALETSPAHTVRYDAVDVDGVRQRVLFTTPPGDGPFPVVFYIQGLSCSSVEFPFAENKGPIVQFLEGLSAAGFATLRVEKSGVGDSEGTPCADIDFATELKGYEAACAWLRTQPDAGPVFLFGHSMGGVFAPLVAQSQGVRGIMVFGTITAPLKTYFLENDVRQSKLRKATSEYMTQQAKLVTRFLEGLLDRNESPGQILAKDAAFKPFLEIRDADETHFHERHMEFWRQLNAINVLEEWKKTEQPVLVLWGQCDVPASQSDHVKLAETLDRATYVEIPHMGHGFDQADSMLDSLRQRSQGEFNPAIVETTVTWMKDVLAKP
ncbi:MAG: alpha/beta fold hydrolase [Candidatus Hydrogenedentes bacterium]|nr:alpha/beta fold hydrolase [Candidatus Hydrogenedentota bacterium]